MADTKIPPWDDETMYDEATFSLEAFLERCHRRHAQNGTPSRPEWKPLPPESRTPAAAGPTRLA